MNDGFSPKRDPLDKALDDLVKAAMRVEYYRHFGRHGDGKDVEAKANLKAARVALKAVIREQA